MSMIDRVDTIFFDAGGTLFRPYPSVGEVYRDVASRYGCRAKADEIEKFFQEAWLKRDGLADLASHSSEKIEREWWRGLVSDVFGHFDPIGKFDAFFEELYDVFGAPECWRLYPETLDVLRELKKRKKQLAIISNWDSRLFRLCHGLGLDEYFDFVLASAVFGAAKPSPKIFQEALRKAGSSVHEAVHIGDSFEDDIQGALRIGMEVILVDRGFSGRHRDRSRIPDVKTIHSLNELL
ncbi:MAG: HAD-IA family hydrolase [Candidatus Omnitrophica bacterium]|nr:HAD-IA family hydrolase [Candidatus Omnitrophota bacterium]